MRLVIYKNGLLILHRDFSSASVRFGRLASCEVVLEGEEVARFHAVIDRSIEGGGFELTDMSGGQTRLNGAPVSRAKLEEGDEIRIGSYKIVIATNAIWTATAEEMASEPVTGEIAVRRELAKWKAK
jgi:pSer/pThr/pTyr-binding forkhead associated (FHA) protein